LEIGPFFPGGIAASPDGQSFYVSGGSENGGEIFQYDIGANGTLSPKSPATLSTGDIPGAVAVSADGRSVYITGRPPYDPTNPVQGYVLQFDVGSGGALSPKSPATVPVGGLVADVAVNPPRVPARKEQCKRGGWHNFAQFRNQGSCVSFVQTHP
jgi:DNA-binding beta-propeller fold protein YncE